MSPNNINTNAKIHPSLSLSKFVKYKLPHYKTELKKQLDEDGFSAARYSAHNCPTLFEMFNFTQTQKTLQITYNILVILEDIQKFREVSKELKGIDKIKLPKVYKQVAKNILEINAQFKLFDNNIIPEINDIKSLFSGIVLLEILETLYAMHIRSKENSKAFPLIIKALTPELEHELPSFPEKIAMLKLKIEKFNEQQNIKKSHDANRKFIFGTGWYDADNPLKSLYSLLNINFNRLAKFKSRKNPLETILKDDKTREDQIL